MPLPNGTDMLQPLHDAKEHPPVLKGEAKEIAIRLEKAQKVLEDEQAQVSQLTDAAAKARGEKQEQIQDNLAIAQEDLNLAQDEVDDAIPVVREAMIGPGVQELIRVPLGVDIQAVTRWSDAKE